MNNKTLGIMGSYPELMQAAQGYRTGGSVSAGQSPLRYIPDIRQPPMPDIGARNPGYAPGLLPTGTVDPTLPGTRRVAPISPAQARRNATLERGAGRSPTYGSGAQPYPSTPDTPVDMRVPRGPEAGLSDRAIDRIFLDFMAGEISSLEQEELTIDDLVDISIARGIPVEDLVAMMPSGVAKEAKQVMGEYLPVPTIGDQVIAPRKKSVVGRDVESLEGPESTGLGGQIRPTIKSAESASDISEPINSDVATDALPENMPEPLRTPEGRKTTAETALSSLDKSYEEKLELFQKVFGDGDEDTSRDRAMSLAMIGLAIAAGQSPNALTNIAQGAMVGLQAMGAKEQARKEKREKTKLLALDAALKEHAAQQEFARELGLEAIKAGNKSQYRDTPTVRQEGAFGDVEVFLPTPEAAQQGAQPVIADVAGLDRKYRQSLEGRQKVFGMVDKAEQLIAEYDIAGFEGAMARFKQDFSAATPKFLKEAFGFDGTSGTPTPQQQYDTLMRAMAAQFTPIILGESGRTISDGDRQRVAQILGFAVDQTTGKIGQYEGTAFTSESELKSALSEVRSILGSSYSEMDRIYSRYRPEQYQQLQEEQKPSNVRRFDAQGNPIK